MSEVYYFAKSSNTMESLCGINKFEKCLVFALHFFISFHIMQLSK